MSDCVSRAEAIKTHEERTKNARKTHECESKECETHEKRTEEPFGNCISRRAIIKRPDENRRRKDK